MLEILYLPTCKKPHSHPVADILTSPSTLRKMLSLVIDVIKSALSKPCVCPQRYRGERITKLWQLYGRIHLKTSETYE